MNPTSKTPLPSLELEFLQEGDQGPLVAQLQSRLALFDYYSGEITGYFDDATKAALQTLQQRHHITEDGYFGPETWYAITFWIHETQFPSVKKMLYSCASWAINLLSRRYFCKHPSSCKTAH